MADPLEHHPYKEFIPKRPTSMIVGSFPIGKFSDPRRRHEIRSHEFHFFFGGERNLLWKLLGQCYERELKSKEDIICLLEEKGIAIGDVIKSCRRKGGGGSDAQLYDIVWNTELLEVIKKNQIKRLYFTSKQVQKWFLKLFPNCKLEQVLLISPSAQSVRSVVKMPAYVEWKKTHKEARVIDFIVESYRQIFT